MKAVPDHMVPLMAVMVEHLDGQRDLITHKSIWHLSDQAMKNVCKSPPSFLSFSSPHSVGPKIPIWWPSCKLIYVHLLAKIPKILHKDLFF